MTQMLQNPFILIDSSSYLYRAYYAIPSMTNREGKPTSVIYGVLNMIRSLISQYQPTHAAVVFDAKGETFRNKLFKHYKSHRLPMPNNLSDQIEPLYEIVKAMGLPLVVVPGVEADDVIGTLAHNAEKIGYSVLISTNDKDMAQLVTSKINLIDSMTKTIVGHKEVMDKYGVPPELIVDFISLVGDTSDNIPGVPGIGKKTTQNLLQEFGGLSTLYTKLGEISSLTFRGAKKLANKLDKHKEIADLSYQLAKIKTDVKLEITCEQLKIRQPLIEDLLKLFKKYEFKCWIADIKSGKWLKSKNNKLKENKIKKPIVFHNENNETESHHYEIILNEAHLKKWLEKLKESTIFAFNIETNCLGNIFADLVGFSFAIEPGIAAYIPISYDYLTNPELLSLNKVLNMLQPLLEDKDLLKLGQNLKYNHSVLRNYGIELRGIAFDVTLEAYILNIAKNSYNKKEDFPLLFEWAEIMDRNKLINYNQMEFKEAALYAAKYIDITLQLHFKIWPELKKYNSLLNIFRNIDIPLVPVLSRIERNGVKIDSSILDKHSKEIKLRLANLEQKVHEIAGQSFNLSSTKELQIILFERSGIKPIKKTPSGMLSTSEKVLEKLSFNHPLPKLILEYRRLAKLKSTYTDKLPAMINKKTGRIHTSYHQTATSTGRLSSTAPNLQNMPVRKGERYCIRRAFIAPRDYVLISADYSQIELRIMAHLSQDEGLITSFIEGKDIHNVTAAEVFNVPLESITIEQRRNAKIINFGLIYGMSAFGLSRQLNIPYKESKKYIDFYFKRYPGVLDYIKRTIFQAKKEGYVETLDGRRLYIQYIKSDNNSLRSGAERTAINAPIQGTAADIIKRAMISIDTLLLEEDHLRAYMIMQIHDELVFEVHKDDVEIISKKIYNLMEDSMKLDVPLIVKLGVGDNWDQAH